MTAAYLQSIGCRVIRRPWGFVVLTRHGHNTECFRDELLPWLDTDEGRAWRAGVVAPDDDAEAA